MLKQNKISKIALNLRYTLHGSKTEIKKFRTNFKIKDKFFKKMLTQNRGSTFTQDRLILWENTVLIEQ